MMQRKIKILENILWLPQKDWYSIIKVFGRSKEYNKILHTHY